jgi:hypothetical protein
MNPAGHQYKDNSGSFDVREKFKPHARQKDMHIGAKKACLPQSLLHTMQAYYSEEWEDITQTLIFGLRATVSG